MASPLPRDTRTRRPPAPWRPPSARQAAWAALAFGIALRAAFVLRADFPLGDGGLFYLMSDELRRAHYALPALTQYNGAAIPFAYPPLGFYLAALLADAGVPLADALRLLPLAATALALVAFYLLARDLLGRGVATAAAVLAYATVPRSYMWLLMGGGLTRALGLLFALLTFWQSYRLYTRREWRYAGGAALFGALTVLSHLGTVPFTVFTVLLLFLVYGRHRHGVVSSLAVGAAVAVLTAPWWGTVVARFGTAPFLAAQASGGGSLLAGGPGRVKALTQLLTFGLDMTAERYLPLVAVLAVVGALASLRPDRIFLPLWLAAILALEVRAAGTYAVAPIALLAGVAVAELIVPALVAAGRRWGRGVDPSAAAPVADPPGAGRGHGSVPLLALGGMALYAAGMAALVTRSSSGVGPLLRPITAADREALAWTAARTPPGSRFLVVTGREWFADRLGEWFPVLAARRAVNVVQGTEWLPNAAFTRAESANVAVQGCARGNADCLATAAGTFGERPDYVYVTKVTSDPDAPCCAPLADAVRADPRFAVVYDGPGALIATPRH